MQRERRQTPSASPTRSTSSTSESVDTHSTAPPSSTAAPSSSPSPSPSPSPPPPPVSPPASSSVTDGPPASSSSSSHDVPSSTPQSSSSSSGSSALSSSSNAPSSSTASPPNTPSPSSTPTPTPPPHASPSHFANSVASIAPTSRLQSSTLTTYTTLVSGQLTTVITPVPTALSSSPHSSPSLHRAATIAGIALAVLSLLLLLLLVTFVYRRHRRKLRERLDALVHRGKAREHRGLLDGEDFFDEDEDGMGLKTYRDGNVSATATMTTQGSGGLGVPGHTHHPSASSTVSSTRATTPVGVPPLAVPDTLGAGLGLGELVNSVMGRRSVHSLEPPEQGAGAGAGAGAVSTTTTTTTSALKTPPLLPATTPLYIDPFRPGSPHQESVYFDLAGLPLSQGQGAAQPPPGIPADTDGNSNSDSIAPTITTTSSNTAASSTIQARTTDSSVPPLPPGAAPPRRGA